MQNKLNCNIILKILHSIDDLISHKLINTSMILMILADSLMTIQYKIDIYYNYISGLHTDSAALFFCWTNDKALYHLDILNSKFLTFFYNFSSYRRRRIIFN